MLGLKTGAIKRRITPLGLAAVILLTALSVESVTSRAEDAVVLKRDLGANDWRVRVAAALALGKTKSKDAFAPLVAALSDQHPSVRAAAAVGLLSLGDRAAVSPLEQAKSIEKTDSVRAQMESVIGQLKNLVATKFLVQIGRLQDKSGANSSAVSDAFKSTAQQSLGSLPGIELLANSADPAVEAKKRSLPAIVLDGTVTKLAKANGSGGDVGFQARVEFIMRKLPDQALKGTVAGDGKALTSPEAMKSEREISQLKVDAVTAATESALKHAPTAIEAAASK